MNKYSIEGMESLNNLKHVLKIMRTTLFLLFFCILFSSASNGYSQKFTVKSGTTTIKKVCEEIEKNSDYIFVFSDESEKVLDNKVNVDSDSKNLSELLNDIFTSAGLSYRILDKQVVVFKRSLPDDVKEVYLDQVKQQPIRLTITGKVTDESNDQPIPGVNVVIAGTTYGTSTDIDGVYELSANEGDTLVFSFIGFVTQKVKVDKVRIINVRLSEHTEMLEETIVVAFGKQKKTDVIGAVTTINPSELKVPSSNLTQSLAGRLSGLISYQRSGEPGRDNADFFIRGVTTFGYSKSPLILIDGFEISANEMARIDPSNIASFSIMKDATSTALYGARGANGVILITTKEGKEGSMKISFRHESSFSMPTQIPKVADGVSYMQLYNEAFFNDNPTLPPYYTAQKINGTINNDNPNVYPNVNWYDELFTNQVYNQRYNLNINGGGKVAQYYLSASYNKDNGILTVDKRNNFNNNISIDRYNLTTNINLNLTPTTRASFKMNGVFERYNEPIFNRGMRFLITS